MANLKLHKFINSVDEDLHTQNVVWKMFQLLCVSNFRRNIFQMSMKGKLFIHVAVRFLST